MKNVYNEVYVKPSHIKQPTITIEHFLQIIDIMDPVWDFIYDKTTEIAKE